MNNQVSIYIPAYNAESTIREVIDSILNQSYKFDEIILVNDGSTDNTVEICRKLISKYKQVRMIELARNFGEHNAVMAGLNHCRGNMAVIMDDDFQNPPSEIQILVDEISTGKCDVVYGEYIKKQHHWFRNLGSLLNGFVAKFALGKPRTLYLSSFKILNRFVINEIINYILLFSIIIFYGFQTTFFLNPLKNQFNNIYCK